MDKQLLSPVRHGLIMAVIALISGALWAGFLATQHASLHAGFESQQLTIKQEVHMAHSYGESDVMHASDSHHNHSGSLAEDAMQRLLRGHIHFMGLGVLVTALLLVTALTTLNKYWKKVLGWSFGLGVLTYPPAWILMGFRTVALGAEGAEASVMWLFGPSVALLLLSMGMLLAVLMVEWLGWQNRGFLARYFFSHP